MKIPIKLKIRRSDWTIKFDKDIETTEKAVGLCIRDTKRILISPNQDRNEIEETFIHELLHACWPEDTCSHRLEEKLVERVAAVLTKTLRDNKLLVMGKHEPAHVTQKLRKASRRKRKTS